MKHFRFRSALVLTWILLLNIEGFCQQNEDFDKNFIPPSPTPYELGKYGSHPVSFYRGTVGIEVPIYTLKHGDFSLPITLSYNSSGIKVEDIASWVGLGWSLNAGGTISIMTKGKSDFIYDRLWIRNEEQLLNKNIPQDDSLNYVEEGIIDSEPDIFNYNFCGYSGQFVLDNNFNIVFTNNSNGLVFTANKNNLSIEGKDLYGRVYLFKASDVEMSSRMERTYAYLFPENIYISNGPWITDPGNSDPIPTAFNLSEIILENNSGRIIFEYEAEIANYLTRMSGKIAHKINYSFNWPNSCSVQLSNLWEDSDGLAFKRYHVTNHSKRLISIKAIQSFSNEATEIKFIASVERLDLKGTKKLDKVEIYRNNNLWYQWTFSQDYFVSDIESQEQLTGNLLHKRLKLQSIQQRNGTGEAVDNGYRFFYFGDQQSSLPNINMPPRTSFDGYDHWDYCNNNQVVLDDFGKPSKLFPDIVFSDFTDKLFLKLYADNNPRPPLINSFGEFQGSYPLMFSEFSHPRGNRSPSINSMKTYSLEKIEYPTNGFTVFEYEPHKVGYGYEIIGGLRMKRIVESSGYNSTTQKEYNYSTGQIDYRPSYITGRFAPWFEAGSSNNPGCHWASNGFLLHWITSLPIYPFGFVLSSTSQSLVHTTNTDYVSYLQVTETLINGTQNEGRTVYSYFYPQGFERIKYDFAYAYIDSDEFPETKQSGKIIEQFSPVYPFKSGLSSPSYKRGLLQSVTYFNSNNKVVKRVENSYKFEDEKIIYGNEVHQENPLEPRYFFISAYKLYAGKSFLETTITTQYDLNGGSPVTDSTKNIYRTDIELPVKKIEYGNDIVETEYKYPIDFLSFYQPNNPYKTMCDLGMINYPLETIRKRNGKVVGANLVKYALFNSPSTIIKQKEMFVFQSDKGVSDFTPISWNFGLAEFNKDSRYSSEVLINKYDKIGRVLEYKKNDLIDNSVIWSSYLRMSPDAIVSNTLQEKTAYSGFDYTTVAGAGIYGNWKLVQGPNWIVSNQAKIGSGAITTMQGSGNSPIESFHNIPAGKYKVSCWQKGGAVTFPSGAVITERHVDDWIFKEAVFQISSSQKITIYINNAIIDELKLSPVDASMISFSYDLFDRMKGKSDDNGFGEKYVYDNAGRLIQIKDMNENILKTFEYNYAH